jgi:hypothetical protein
MLHEYKKEGKKMKRVFASFLLVMFPLLLFGCLADKESGLSTMKSYTNSKIAIAPFECEKEAEDLERLTIDVGTMLSLLLKENEWIFDKSEDLQPIGCQLSEHQLSPGEIYDSPALAAKIGKALGVDVIIVGCVSNPRIKCEDDCTQYYDKSLKGGFEGSLSTRYTLLKQSATIDVDLKAVDVQNQTVVWTRDNLKGYIKYIKSFQAQTPRGLKHPNEDKIVKADLLRHLTLRITHALYPDHFEDRAVPEIIEKPEQNLIGAGGKPIMF